jgi:hypothetical protein
MRKVLYSEMDELSQTEHDASPDVSLMLKRKLQPQAYCACGRRISSNKQECLACAVVSAISQYDAGKST